MATIGERVARLEVQAVEYERRIELLEDNYNGGGDIEYHRSVRGRLHTLEGAQVATAIVTKQRVRIVKGGTAFVVNMAALVVAACAVVSTLHVLFG